MFHMRVVHNDHLNLMVWLIDPQFHSMMQRCIEQNLHRKKFNHVQQHFLSEFHPFQPILHPILFEFSTPRSGFVLAHVEPTGHKFYQPQQELYQRQYQQQPITA